MVWTRVGAEILPNLGLLWHRLLMLHQQGETRILGLMRHGGLSQQPGVFVTSTWHRFSNHELQFNLKVNF
jgi:hypothetical protein